MGSQHCLRLSLFFSATISNCQKLSIRQGGGGGNIRIFFLAWRSKGHNTTVFQTQARCAAKYATLFALRQSRILIDESWRPLCNTYSHTHTRCLVYLYCLCVFVSWCGSFGITHIAHCLLIYPKMYKILVKNGAITTGERASKTSNNPRSSILAETTTTIATTTVSLTATSVCNNFSNSATHKSVYQLL